ncbi:MAG: flagellar biosynthesis regulator FlaF, partial [Pseudomonadota bacterium]
TQAESPREIEYRAFGMATAGLVRIKEGAVSGSGAIAEALDFNRRLWNVLSADCATEGNKLPPSLRAQIISLGLWVARYSSQVLREGVEVDPLIDVNRAMMEGLAAR